VNKIEKAVTKVAQLPPEAIKALLLKIRKGADAAITLPQTLHIIELFGGTWELEPGFVPMKGIDSRTGRPFEDEIHTVNRDGDQWIASRHAEYKAKEISELPSHAVPGDRFITNVSSVGKNAYDWLMFTFIEWSVVYGIRINMPDGQSELFLPEGDDIRREGSAFITVPGAKPYSHRVLWSINRWLKNETDYVQRVCQLLNMEEHVPAAERTRDNTGCCPVCFREMKLEPGNQILVMVSHGFKRPRYLGRHVGNCYGVGFPPYELSKEGVIAYINGALLIELSRVEMVIGDVESDVLNRYPDTWNLQAKPIERGQPRFEECRKRYHDGLLREREFLNRHIALYQTFVDEWKPRELPREGGPPRAWMREITRKIK